MAPPGWWIPLVTGKFLFFSPNLVWLAIALFDYFVFPYDFQAARSFDYLDWVCFRSDIMPIIDNNYHYLSIKS